MAVKVLVPPTAEPVSLAEFKIWMRGGITTEQEDMVASLLTAGREKAEKYQNAAYIEQTLQVAIDAPTMRAIVLPRPPFKELVSVVCYDSSGVGTDITDAFSINDIARPAEMWMKEGQSWPSISYRAQNPIVITYKAGGTADDVPQRVKQAILVYAAWAKMYPTAEKPLPDAFYHLLDPGRIKPVR